MIDTLLTNRERAAVRLPALRTMLSLDGAPFAVATLHRPSNVDNPATLARVISALQQVSEMIPVVLPAHPRTRAHLDASGVASRRLRIIEPLGYLDFLALQSAAALVLTDSGGVQEETTALGIPCLTMRESTERPITVTEGTNEVVGTDVGRIVAAAERVLRTDVPKRAPALWDGKAGQRIADVLIRCVVAGAPFRRPTDV